MFTNLYMHDSIWIVSTHFCMLPPSTQHIVSESVFSVNEPRYTRNTSLHHVTNWLQLNHLAAVK